MSEGMLVTVSGANGWIDETTEVDGECSIRTWSVGELREYIELLQEALEDAESTVDSGYVN